MVILTMELNTLEMVKFCLFDFQLYVNGALNFQNKQDMQ